MDNPSNPRVELPGATTSTVYKSPYSISNPTSGREPSIKRPKFNNLAQKTD